MTTARKKKPTQELSGKQRGFLRSLAHHIEPLVQIGKEGLSEGVVDAVARALLDHELIKVRILESSPEGRREIAEPLATASGSHVVGQVGRIVILYRMHDEKPTIDLPRR